MRFSSRPIALTAVAFAASFSVAAAPASAQGNPADTYAFLATVAEKGAECDLLRPWESATVLTEADRFLSNLTPEEQGAATTALDARLADTACDNAAMNEWIEGARPGIEAEWLPPYLALVHAFADLDPPPPIFVEATAELDLDAAVAAIDAQFAALDANGIRAEGGETWDQFLETVRTFAYAMAAAVTSGDNELFTAVEAEALILDSTLITSLWLDDPER